MLKKIRTISAALMLLCGMAACLPEYNTQHDINIARFYFRASDTAPDINSIEFAVDTVAMTITNADSLAFTSSLAQVVPVIECYSVPSAIAINGVEWNQTDTLDLSVQPVKVTIIGSDKVTSCDYTLTINQHKVDPDSIIWTNMGEMFAGLSGADDIYDIYAVQAGNRCYMAASSSQGGVMIVSDNGNDWEVSAEYDENINIRTMNVLFAADDLSSGRLFAIGDNQVYEWSENKWTVSKQADENYACLDVLGSVDGRLAVLVRNEQDNLLYIMELDNGQWIIHDTPLYANDFPVAGSAKISNAGVPFLLGGCNASGGYVGTVYSSMDLSYWTNLLTSATDFGFGNRAEAAAFFVDGKWFLSGGLTADGSTSTDMYYSADNCYSWNAVPAKQTLPQEYGARRGVSAFVSADENIWLVGGRAEGDVYPKLDLWRGRMNKSDFLIR